MSLESSEVVVGGTGHVWRAPVGTAFPTNISTAVNEALWTELGYTTEDGVHFAFGRNVNEIMGWQSYDPLRIIVTSVPRSIKATFLQFNQNTWNTAMGGGTWTEPTNNNFLYVPPSPGTLDQFAYIVEWTDGSLSYRFCARKVQVIDPIEFDLKRTDPINLPINVKVLAADAGANPFDFYTNDENLGDYTLAGS